MSMTLEEMAERLARFEKGVSADPTVNMSEEDKAKWEAMNDEHGDKFKTAAVPDPQRWANALEDYIQANPLSLGDSWDIVKMSSDEFKVECRESVMFLHAKSYDMGEGEEIISIIGKDARGKNLKRQFPVDAKLVPSLIRLLDTIKPKPSGRSAALPGDITPPSESDAEAKFEEGKPADPTENMTEEQRKEWWKQHGEHKDEFTSGSGSEESNTEGRFEEGKPADPTENMSEEDKKKWQEYHGQVDKLASIKSEALRVVMKDGLNPQAVAGLLLQLLAGWEYGAGNLAEDFGRLTRILHGGRLVHPDPSTLKQAQAAVANFARGSTEESEAMADFVFFALQAVNAESVAVKAKALILGTMLGRKEAAAGLYGFTKSVQSDCEGAFRKIQRQAKKIMQGAAKRDGKVAEFLAAHARRADSLPARLLVAAFNDLSPKVEIEPVKEAGTSVRGLYGFPTKTARLGLNACSELRAFTGEAVEDLHIRRAARHPHITGFLQEHIKAASDDHARMILSCYPEGVSKEAAAPRTVEGWLAWDD